MSFHRNLELIKKTGSTSRILNLHLIHELNRESDDFKKSALFENPRLNRSMIIKHTMRASEDYLFDKRQLSGTKVILPFDNEDLRIGATNVFVGQRNFLNALAEIVGGFASDDAMRRDARLLMLLAELPSLDPFLLRERLKQAGHTVARCFFQISDGDLAKMQTFVGGEIQKLVDLAFGGAGGRTSALSGQMAQKILSDENTDALAPLKVTLGLNGQEWSEGVFSWKGFLYYKWCFSSELGKASQTLTEMGALSLARCDLPTGNAVRAMRERGQAMIRSRMKKIAALLEIYNNAFKALAEQGNPSAFRKFLLDSPNMFIEIGEHMGIVSHLSSFWNFKVGRKKGIALEATELLDIFQEVESCNWAETHKHATEMAW